MRLLLKTFLWLVFAVALGAAGLLYVLHNRGQALDVLIEHAAEKRGLDPRLFAALVASAGGTRTTLAENGCYGLLRLTEADGRAWATASGRKFDTFDLFAPAANLEIGAWKFDAELRAWSRAREPEVWAVASWWTNHETVAGWAVAAQSGTNKALAYITDPVIEARVRSTLMDARTPRPWTARLPQKLREWMGRWGEASG